MAGTRHADCDNGCPPDGTPDVSGKWYHLCCTDPVSHTGEVLKTAKECGKFPKADACQRCGISVFPSAADCVLLSKILPPAVSSKWKFVAVAVLSPAEGWVKPTPGKLPSHHTWWSSNEVIDRCSFFIIACPV